MEDGQCQQKQEPEAHHQQLIEAAEWGEKMALLKKNEAFSKVLDLRFKSLKSQTLRLTPLEKDKFAIFTSQRAELFNIVKEITTGIIVGEQARMKMKPGYVDPKPHMV